MPRSDLPVRTIELLDRVDHGDREAALDLAAVYRPEDIDDFVRWVWTREDTGPPTWLFDNLADAYDAWVEAA